MGEETEREQDREHCPGYDFDALIAWMVGNGMSPEEIRVIECPDCGVMTYVKDVEKPSCLCCGHPLENHLEKVISLAEYWERLLSGDVLWTGGEA